MSLLTVSELRAQVATSLDDVAVQAVITREEADVIRLYGPHYVDANTTVSETLAGGYRSLYLRQRIASVTSVTEYPTSDSTSGTLLTAGTSYRVWGSQGRIERMPSGSRWGAIVDVVYKPVDDRELRRAAIVDLVRLALERTAMKSESVAGEYSYTAPDWAAARSEILSRLGFINV